MAGNDIYVAGWGKVPMTYHGELKDVNFDVVKEDHWNYHDEATVQLNCQPETDFFQIDDNVTIDGTFLPNGGYKLSMKFDSDSHVELFKSGQVELTYDPELRSWTMLASKGSMNEWLFCSPSEAMDIVISALTCYATTKDAQDVGTAGAALIFKGSLEAAKDDTVSRAHLYTDRQDCTVDMPKKIEESRSDACTKSPCW